MPVAAGAMRAATAAAEPPEEPPGTSRASHGLRTGPKCDVSLEEHFDKSYRSQCSGSAVARAETFLQRRPSASAEDAAPNTARIRALNDAFRTAGPGQAAWMLTWGVQGNGPSFAWRQSAPCRISTGSKRTAIPMRSMIYGVDDFAIAGGIVMMR